MVRGYTDELLKLAKEVIVASTKPYTEEQTKEIPRIIDTKSRYFWANDLSAWDVLTRDVFVADAIKTYWNGNPGAETGAEQAVLADRGIGPAQNIFAMHFAHNQLVQFLDDTHARLLTRMNDHHVYKDNEEIYAGYGIYVDDLVKCDDGVWRIETLRLDYSIKIGKLRPPADGSENMYVTIHEE